jgi:hypothetical protein
VRFGAEIRALSYIERPSQLLGWMTEEFGREFGRESAGEDHFDTHAGLGRSHRARIPMSGPLHPRHGIHDPTSSTPPRARGSIRRTSTIDMLRPDGLLGGVVLVGRARDLATSEAGEPTIVGDAGFVARVNFLEQRKIVSMCTAPFERGVASLVGVNASSGFRAQLDRALPEHRDARSPLYLLLDDLPVAALVSGYAIGAGGVPMPARGITFPADLCAGWRTGGTMLAGIEEAGHLPAGTGPPAPGLARADDPIAWHEMAPLPAHGMRRHRRLDLTHDDALVADVLFRDSHVDADGRETIVHEYTVRAEIEPSALRVESIAAEAHVLPWVECEDAVPSARRLVGRSVASLRPDVRAGFTGPSTCTHLNDTLRSLEDVATLHRLIAPAGVTTPAGAPGSERSRRAR